jgi:hypothetical protein
LNSYIPPQAALEPGTRRLILLHFPAPGTWHPVPEYPALSSLYNAENVLYNKIGNGKEVRKMAVERVSNENAAAEVQRARQQEAENVPREQEEEETEREQSTPEKLADSQSAYRIDLLA